MESKRIGAFVIDWIITAVIMDIPFWILVLYPLIKGDASISNTIIIRTLISTYIAMLYMIFRDCIGSRSVGKKILKLKIIDSQTKKEAKIPQKIVRNITWLLGPVEIPVYLIMNKRLGDVLAKTEVTTAI